MKTAHKFTSLVIAGSIISAVPSAHAAVTIAHEAGVADWTFFYDNTAGTFDVVFRTKPSTIATGLDSPYAGPTGGVGGSSDDFNYDTLGLNITAAPSLAVNGNSYYVTPATGTAYDIATQPDLGVRTRLRQTVEDVDGNAFVINQFAAMRMNLDWAASTKPAGAEFILFQTDISGDPTVINFETAANDLQHDWSNWGHSHWHFGFSQTGEYELVFEVQGVGGILGNSSITTTSLNFEVIPEPSSALLVPAALALLALRRRRA